MSSIHCYMRPIYLDYGQLYISAFTYNATMKTVGQETRCVRMSVCDA